MILMSSPSSIPLPLGAAAQTRRGGEGEPIRRTTDWRVAFAEAHQAWARRFAPWLLEEWNA